MQIALIGAVAYLGGDGAIAALWSDREFLKA